MRCHRMRGYGVWCAGWREGERRGGGGPGIFFYGFMLLVVFSFFKVALETGNPMAFVLGLAVIAGIIKSQS